MKRIENIFGYSKIDRKQFRKNGEVICNGCNGTGINPDYKIVNRIQTAIDELCKIQDNSYPRILKSANTKVPYCLNCYGMKKIDWAQYATGNYTQELMDRNKKMRKKFLDGVDPFLRYIHCGEVWCNDYTPRDYFSFNLENKSWYKTDGLNKDSNSLRVAYKWLNSFIDDGYFDLDNVADVAPNYQELYWIEPEEQLQLMKINLLVAKNISMSRLLEIKNDLDLFWYDIQDLDHIETEYEIIENLSNGFKFTWENILRKFGLSLTYLCLFNSEEVKSKK
jgi:hypothetical protein